MQDTHEEQFATYRVTQQEITITNQSTDATRGSDRARLLYGVVEVRVQRRAEEDVLLHSAAEDPGRLRAVPRPVTQSGGSENEQLVVWTCSSALKESFGGFTRLIAAK